MNTSWEQWLSQLKPRTRWGMIVGAFLVIALLDYGTPSEYIWAYLYVIPILFSVSFLKPRQVKQFVFLAVMATLLNLFIPENALFQPFVVINRLLSAGALVLSAFYMIRYVRYQQRFQEQENLLMMQQSLATMREDFIATLTHDLKTPLLGEEQALNHLIQENMGPLTSEQKELVAVLQRGNRRQLDLVQTLVTTYKNDNLGVPLQPVLIDLDEVIADVLIEMQYLARERQIRMTYVCEATPPLARADVLQIKRVLANLLHNALNYTPGGSVILITLYQTGQMVRIDVEDSGPGIAPADLENVFKRFYQSGEKRHVIGTGLGLYLSRQIILAHRGQIWVENREPVGCRFSFTLPIALHTGLKTASISMEKEAQ